MSSKKRGLNYSALANRDHAADGAKGAAARERNRARRRIEQLERGIASGELKGMGPVRLLELWRHDEDYLDKVLVAESREVQRLRAEAEALVRQQEEELRRLVGYRREAADLQELIAEREEQLGDMNELHAKLQQLGIKVAA